MATTRAFGRTLGATGRLLAGLSPLTGVPRPHRTDHVDAAFLTRTLGSDTPGALVTDVHVEGGTSGTTDRLAVRLDWNDTGAAAGLPTAVFIKATPVPAQNRALLSTLRLHEGEVGFYRDARDAVGDIAPRAFHGETWRGGRMLLLLEDLAARGCTMPRLADEATLAQAEARVAALVELHVAFWESPRFDGDLDWLPTQTSRPGFGLMQRMFAYCRNHLVKHREELATPHQVIDFVELMNARNRDVQHLWDDLPLTLCHGDTHLGNSYDQPDGSAGYLDWQVVHRSHGLRDVTYFMITSLPVELRRRHERDLLDAYRDRMLAAGVTMPTPSGMWELYRLFATEAWDASISAVAFAGLQDRDNAIASMHRGNQAVIDLELHDVITRAADGVWRPNPS